MNGQRKQVYIALAILVCAAALVVGGYLCVSVSSMLPIAPEDISFCHVTLHALCDEETKEETVTLTQEQTQELFRRLSTAKYRLDAPSLFFSGGTRCG